MNRENLLRVADAIERSTIPDVGFNMRYYIDVEEDYAAGDLFRPRDWSGHPCRTTACIAGHAYLVKHGEICDHASSEVVYVEARAFLGLTKDEAQRLFIGRPRDIKFGNVSSPQAARTLRHAAEHGVINWNAANPEESV